MARKSRRSDRPSSSVIAAPSRLPRRLHQPTQRGSKPRNRKREHIQPPGSLSLSPEMNRDKQATFLVAYQETMNIRKAAQVAGLSRSTVMRWRDNDPMFRAQMDEVWEGLVDDLEGNTMQKATHGWDEPIIHKGRITGTKRAYNPILMIFMLKSNRPERYNDRVTPAGPTPGDTATAIRDFLIQTTASHALEKAAGIDGTTGQST